MANGYVEYLLGEGEHLLSLVADDFWDNEPSVWTQHLAIGATWLSNTFADVAVDLHSVAQDDDSRLLVWVTLHGTHIGSAFPFLRERAPTGRRVAWSQVHVFRVEADSIIEDLAVRGDLQLLEAIDLVVYPTTQTARRWPPNGENRGSARGALIAGLGTHRQSFTAS